MSLLLYEAFILVLTTGLLLLLSPFANERKMAPLGTFVALSMLDALCLLFPLLIGWRVGQWNWIGKFASISLGLAAILFLRLGKTELGLIVPRSRRTWLVSVAGLFISLLLITLFVLLFGPNSKPNVPTLAYEATMPGVDEELWYRGIYMALLMRGFPRVRFRMPTWVVPLVITSLQFTAVHVVTIDHGHLGLAMMGAMFVLPIGLLLAAIRVASGSLLGGVITHNATNVFGALLAFL